MSEYMSYDEYLKKVKEGIVTDQGNCPVTPLLVMLQGKWKTQVLYEFCIHDHIRFGELKKDLPGITNTMLTNTLRDLEKDGLIVREQFNEIPPHVEYSFSDMGRDLLPVFYSIMVWGFKHEPSTGLHASDIEKLLALLRKLVSSGNTVVMVEHRLELIAQADWIIDMGPDGGSDGGEAVFTCTPEQLLECELSKTGQYLRQAVS